MGARQDLVTPLGDERIGNDHERLKISTLVFQRVQDHQCLYRLAEAHLVGQQMPNSHVGEDAMDVRHLVGVRRGGDSECGSERCPNPFELPSDGLSRQTQIDVCIPRHESSASRIARARSAR